MAESPVMWNNLKGPAVVHKDKNGNVKRLDYYIQGHQLPPGRYFGWLRKRGLELPEPYYTNYLNSLSPNKKAIEMAKNQKVSVKPEAPVQQQEAPPEFIFDFGDI